MGAGLASRAADLVGEFHRHASVPGEVLDDRQQTGLGVPDGVGLVAEAAAELEDQSSGVLCGVVQALLPFSHLTGEAAGLLDQDENENNEHQEGQHDLGHDQPSPPSSRLSCVRAHGCRPDEM